ncbi:MAG: redoxin domain-containing protein [Fimbriimonadaceae bacterium]|nr:redoxin domain-containing protein [Fimbriimonadaceae bacterium]
MRTILWATLLCAATVQGQSVRAGAQTGLPAPRFAARPVNGPAVSLDALRRPGGALVAFCDPRSQDGAKALGFIESAQTQLTALQVKPVAFVINFSQSGSVQKLVKDNGLTVPVAHDSGQSVARQYGVDTSAVLVVVHPDGKVYRRFDATESNTDLGPAALAACKQLFDELTKAAEEAAQPAAAAPATAATSGPAPVTRPSDEQTRQRIGQGWSLIQGGFVSAALEDARMLAEQRGNDLMATLWLAYCLEVARLYPEAAVTYRKVLLLQPGHVYALQAVGRIDPDGRWRTAADLPRPIPPAGPVAEPAGATTRSGPATIGP